MSASLPASDATYESSPRGYLARQFTTPVPLPASLDLTGQTAIVTGSNTGLGFEACRQLLQRGLSHLVMGVRSQVKGDAAAERLREEFLPPAASSSSSSSGSAAVAAAEARIDVWQVDLASYDSVRAFAGRCAGPSLPRIDLAILNAALVKPGYTVAAETGRELTLQVNYLSTALLATLLLAILRSKSKSKRAGAGDAEQQRQQPPTITVVGSDMQYMTTMARPSGRSGGVLAQLDTSEGYDQMGWYSREKLLLAFFVQRLSTQVDPGDVVVNVANPGSCGGTDFFREWPWLAARVMRVLHFFLARTADKGAGIYIEAARVRGAESHGSFVSDWAYKP